MSTFNSTEYVRTVSTEQCPKCKNKYKDLNKHIKCAGKPSYYYIAKNIRFREDF